MKKALLLLVLIFSLNPLFSQTTLAHFGLNNTTETINPTPDIDNAQGTPSATLNGLAYSTTNCEGSHSLATTENAKYLDVFINTSGFNAIKISWKQTRSGNGNDKLFWILNAFNGTNNIQLSNATFSSSCGLVTITITDNSFFNNPNVKFTFVSSGGNNGSTPLHLDDITITGTPIVVANPILTPTTLAGFGDVCLGETPINNFTISGSNLTTAPITVGALNGYTYSTSLGGTYANSLSLTDGADPYSQTIYVKFTPTNIATNYNGSILIGGGGAPSVNVAASGNGVTTPSATISNPHPNNTTVCYQGIGTQTSISWNAVNSATSYDVYFGAGSLPVTVTQNVTTTSYNIGALTAMTTYYWKVVSKNACGAAVGATTYSFTTANTPCSDDYCNDSNTITEVRSITRVKFTNIDNSSSPSTGSTSYEDYTAIVGTVYQGETTNPFIVEGFTNGNNQFNYSVFIDWNQNGTFDSGEGYYAGTITGSTGVDGIQTGTNIVIPANATLGTTRMRVISSLEPLASDPCVDISAGQIEDYTIKICALPVANCKNIDLFLDPSGNAILTPSQIDNVSTANCGLDLSISKTNFNCSNIGANTVTLTVTDLNGKVSTCNATVNVKDNLPPTVMCSDLTVSLNASGSVTVPAEDVDGGNSVDNCGIDSYSLDTSTFTCANLGANYVTLTVTDVNGNSNTCLANITVVDNINPTIVTLDAISVNTDAGQCTYASSQLTPPSASDNCSVVSVIASPASLSIGDNTVTWTATDSSDLTATSTQTVTVTDNQVPTISCPSNSTTTATSASGAVVTYTTPVGADNCPGSITVLTAGLASGSMFPIGDTTVTYEVTDGTGLTAECSFTVTVSGLDPVISCPTDITQNNDAGLCSAVVNFSATETTGIPASTITYSQNPGTVFPVGTTTVTATATNVVGSTSCFFDVIVEDKENPSFTTPIDLTIECDQDETNLTITGDVTDESDNCPTTNQATYSDMVAAGSCPNASVITRTWSLTDDHSNTITQVQTITVQDNTVPTITTTASDSTVESDGAGNATELNAWLANNGGAVASDNCGSVTWSNDFTALNDLCGETGSATVTFTATDACGLTSTTTATFTIQDTTVPSIDTAASDETVESDGAGNATELNAWLASNGNTGAATDNNGVTWTHNYGGTNILSDDCGATGSVEVIFTATDACGLTSTTTATFTIEDTTEPTITTEASDETVESDGAGNATELNAWLASNGNTGAATDNNGVTWTHNYGGTNILSDDCGATGSVEVIFTATDACGLTSTTTATFTIQDTTVPSIDTAASPETVESDGAGNTTALNAWLASNGGAIASDINGGVTWSNDFTALSDLCGATGAATVTFTATDDCGLTSTTTATFTIEDTTVPSIDTAASPETVESDGAGNTTALNAWLASNGGAIASDINGGVTWSNDFTALSDLCGATGAATVTFTATDDCGLTSTTTATFTIEDTTVPSIDTAASPETVESDGAGNTTALNDWLASNGNTSAATDNNGVTWTHNYGGTNILSDDCGATGSVEVIFTATDACGLTSTTTATFTIEDTTDPTITTEASDETVESDGAGNATELNDWLASNGNTGAATDNNGVTWTHNYGGTNILSDDCGATGSVEVIFTATDACGLTSTMTATFTIEDTTDPTITTEASDETVESDGAGNATELNDWLASNGNTGAATDNNGVTWTHNYGGTNILSDDCGATGSVEVIFTATDACGLTSTTTATFTIEDTTDPTITTEASDETVESDGAGNATELNDWLASNGNTGAATDNNGVTWTHNYGGTNILSDDCGATGSVEVIFTATDACGLTSTTTATFTIEDTTDPTITTAASDETVESDGAGNTTALNDWLASNGNTGAATDNNGVTWTHNYGGTNILSDDCGATGSVEVIFTATDACGLTSTTTATFTIEDTTDPTITTEASNETVESDGAGNATELNAWLASNGTTGAATDNNGVTWTHNYGGTNILSDDCGATGSVEVIFTATDACGLTSTTTATFTIEDTTDPTITTEASNETVESDGAGNATELNAWLASNGTTGAATDNNGVTWTHNYGGTNILSDDCGATGSVEVIFTATDACGLTSTTTATFTIEDTTEPTITTEASDETVESDGAGNATELNAWLASNGNTGAATDNNGVTWTHNYGGTNILSDDCGATGSVEVIFTATDACGLTSTTTATFTIQDTTVPSIDTAASPETVESDGAGNTTALNAWLASNGGAIASDINGGVTWSNDFTALSDLCGATGAATVTFTATDDCGLTSTTTATFTIEDTTVPSIDTAASPETVESDGAGNTTALNDWLASNGNTSAATDNNGVTWTHNYGGTNILSDDCGATGSVEVIFTATDACGLTSTTTATFTIQDTTVPSIDTAASPETVESDGAGNTTALNAWLASNGGAIASDINGGVTWSNDFTALSDLCGATGAATVTFTATDDCGLTSTTTATFTIEDTTVPSIDTAASPETVESDGAGNTTALNDWLASNGNTSAATDNNGVTWTHNYGGTNILSDDCGATGSVEVIFTATDACGLTSTTTATFTIQDTTVPSIDTAASPETVESDGAGNTTALNAWLASNGGAIASDINGGVTWSNDFTALSDLCGATGAATVTFTATDDCGLTSTTTATFTIEDTTVPSIDTAASPETVESDGAGNTTALNDWLASNGNTGAATDNNGVTWTHNYGGTNILSDDCGATGSVEVIFTATDACGLTSTTTATFTIEDTTDPTITTEASHETVESDGAGNATELNDWLASNGNTGAATDNNGVTWTHNYGGTNILSDDCGATGSVEVIFTATDACGLTSTTTATFTIEDTTDPTITTEASDETVESDGAGNATELNDWLASNGNTGAATDNNGVTWTHNYGGTNILSDDCGATGSVEVIFTATDACGLTSTTTATFTIEDTTDPTITAEASDETVESDGAGNATELNDWLASNGNTGAATDNNGVTWTHNYGGTNILSDDCGATGSVEVIFTATDACGLTSTTTATFTIEDTTDPTITTAASDETVESDGAGNTTALNDWLASNGNTGAATDNNGVTWTHNYGGTNILSDDCGATGSVEVIFTATDACGLTSTTTATFTIEDTTDPTITTEASNETVESDGAGNATELNAWLASNGTTGAATDNNGVTWTHNYGGTNILSDDCGATGSVEVIFTATDACGLTSTTTATFTIEDTTEPTITTEASDETVESDGAGNATELNDWLASNGNTGAATDNNGVTWTHNYGGTNILSDDCGATGSVEVIFTATDACGLTSTTTATFTIEDTTEPMITTEASDETVESDGAGNATELNAWLASNGNTGAATDNNGVTWTHNYGGTNILSDDCGATGSVEVIFTATDACGLTSTTTAIFTIQDTTVPSIDTAASDETVECDGAGNTTALNDWLASNGNTGAATDNNGVTWTHNYGGTNILSDDCGATGSVEVIFTATDACGLTSTTTANFTIQDTTAPDLTIPVDVTINCEDDFSSVLNGIATATDVCSEFTITESDVSTQVNNVNDPGYYNYTITRTWTATDDCGNENSKDQLIIVQDITPPVVDCLNLTVTLDDLGSGSINISDIDNDSYDNCSPITYSLSQTSFNCSDIGGDLDELIISEYVDGSGNNKWIELYNGTGKTIIFADDEGNIVNNYSLRIYPNGNSTPVTIGLIGEIFDRGVYKISHSDAPNITGIRSNRGTPSVTFDGNDVIALAHDGNNVDVIGVFGTAGPWVAGPNTTAGKTLVRNKNVYQGRVTDFLTGLENEWTQYDQNTVSDIGTHEIEITNQANNVILTVTDVSGNVSTCEGNVTVVDATAPVVICQNVIVQLDATGNGSTTAAAVDNGSSDACGIASLELSQTDFTCENVGDNTVTLTVTDNNGNVSKCTATVTVEDKVAPTVVTQDLTVYLDEFGIATITPADIDDDSTDNCEIATYELDIDNFGCFNNINDELVPININNMVVVTLTVTDENDNITSNTAIVTVMDIIPPTPDCNIITVTLEEDGSYTLNDSDVADIGEGSTDNCAIATMTVVRDDNSLKTFTCDDFENYVSVEDNGYDEISIPITLTVTDVNGNPSTCETTIKVRSIIPEVTITQSELPEFCQGAVLVLTANSDEAIAYEWDNGATTQSTEVTDIGTYTVTVTSATNCSTTTTYDVTGFDAGALISSYTILAKEDVYLHGNNLVQTGAVGVTAPGSGLIKLHQASTIVGRGQAANFNLNQGSTIGTPVNQPANPVIPAFLFNTQSTASSPNVTVNSNTTLAGSVYNSVTVKQGVTVTFSQSNVYINELKTFDGAKIEFEGCANVYLNTKFMLAKGGTINSAGNNVVFYVNGDVQIEQGSNVRARIHTNNNEILAKGANATGNGNGNNAADPTYMTGLFIASRVHGNKNVIWNADTLCSPCPVSGGNATTTANSNTLRSSNFVLTSWPNPSDTEFNIKLKTENKSENANIKVFDMNNKLIHSNEFHPSQTYKFGKEFQGGVYIVKVNQGNSLATERVVKY